MRADLSHAVTGEATSGFDKAKRTLTLFCESEKVRADLSHVITGEPTSGQPWSAVVSHSLPSLENFSF